MGKEIESSVDFPLPQDKVLFLDLDETILDTSYNLTTGGLQSRVSRLEHTGWSVGLNSDTPLPVLHKWVIEFGMSGPIIAERGAIVSIGLKDIIQEDMVDITAVSRKAIVNHFNNKGVYVWQAGDPVKLLRKKNPLIGVYEGMSVVLFNNLRKCSVSFFVRRASTEGVLVKDSQLTHKLCGEIRDLLPPYENLVVDVNETYGILIAYNGTYDKRAGVQCYLQEAGKKQVAMVGNSMTDFVGDDVAVQYAVSNASEEYKQNSDYISEFSYTAGVIDILEQLLRY